MACGTNAGRIGRSRVSAVKSTICDQPIESLRFRGGQRSILVELHMPFDRKKSSRPSFTYSAPLPLARLILPDNCASLGIDVMDRDTVNEYGGSANVLRRVVPISQRETTSDLG